MTAVATPNEGSRPAPAWTVAPYFAAPKVYRIAVLGGSGAGKTCLLAALGLPGRSHPAGLSCVRQDRLPRLPDGRRPGGDPGGVPTDRLRRDPVLAFFRADRWLRDAETRLLAGRSPEGNPVNLPPLLAVYSLTAPGRGELTVEMVDFPGEWIRAGSSNREDYATLRAFVRTLDGLVILAEVHPPGGTPSANFGELLQAFSELTDGRRTGALRDLPVAVVFNKWDRRGRPGAGSGERLREIEALLAESPLHRQLLDDVTGRVVATGRFAASAFGRHDGPSGADQPAGVPAPYGLEDPFVWVCGEADRLGWERLTEEAHRLRWWAVWGVLRSRRVRAAAAAWQDRVHPTAGPRRDAVELADRARRLATAHAVIWAAILGTGVWFAWRGYDRRQQEHAAAARAADEMAWEHALTAPDPVRKERLGAYRQRNPEGRHLPECERLLGEITAQEQAQAGHLRRRAAVDTLRGNLAAAKAANTEAAVARVRAEYRLLPAPQPGVETEAEVRARRHLGDEIDAALVAVTTDDALRKQRAEWAARKQQIDRLVEHLELKRAAVELRNCTIPLPEVDEFRGKFGTAVLTAARLSTALAIQQKIWDDPLQKLEAGLQDTEFTAAVPDPGDRDRIGECVRELKRAKDRALYDDFRNVQTRANADRYLRDAPVQSMRPTAAAFVAWDDARKADRRLGVEVEIGWAKWPAVPTLVDVEVRRGSPDAPWVAVAHVQVEAATDQASAPIPSSDFDCKPEDLLGVRVTIARVPGNYVFSSRLAGGRTIEGKTAEQFKDGHSETIAMANGTDRGTTPTVRVTNLPTRPVVGPWKD